MALLIVGAYECGGRIDASSLNGCALRLASVITSCPTNLARNVRSHPALLRIDMTTATSIATFYVTPGVIDACGGDQARLDFIDTRVARYQSGDYGRGDSDYGIYSVPFATADGASEIWISPFDDPDESDSPLPIVYLAPER